MGWVNKVLTPTPPKAHEYDKLMGFDIETAGDDNEFVLACFYSDDLKRVCSSKAEVIEFISSRAVRDYKIFATNLGFDFLGVLYENSNQWSVTERRGTIYSFKWYQEIVDGKLTRPVTFYDTLRIHPTSVEKLGKLLGQPKIKHPACFKRHPANEAERIELTEYCLNDAKISYLFIKNIVVPFIDKYNIPLKSTIGSLALADFRTNFLTEPVFQEPERNREICFKSYYGGRTETFQRGFFTNVFCFDINSLYPSVMLNAMPNPNKHKYYAVGSLYNINTYEGVSEVLVEVPANIKIPPLPYKKGGKLIFPTGTFRGYYNHNELCNAMKYGVKLLEIKEQLIYPQTKYYFKDFIEHHYAERNKLKADKNPLEVMEKNIMNNLYGKFAFNYRESSSIIPAHEFDIQKHLAKASFVLPMCCNKFISIETLNEEVPVYSFPIWSSYITSYARIKMYEFLSNNSLQDRIISTDTDSIFIYNYQNEIKTSNKLGDMKLEDGYPCNMGYFVRPKMYMTEKPKCKGVKFDYANPENAHAQFMAILDGDAIVQERFIKFRTALNSKDAHKWGKLKPNQIIEITKTLSLEDSKRVWVDKFDYLKSETSTPITINHIDEERIVAELVDNARARLREIEVLVTKKDKVINQLDRDLFDFASKGDDISDEEFLENEIMFELLE